MGKTLTGGGSYVEPGYRMVEIVEDDGIETDWDM